MFCFMSADQIARYSLLRLISAGLKKCSVFFSCTFSLSSSFTRTLELVGEGNIHNMTTSSLTRRLKNMFTVDMHYTHRSKLKFFSCLTKFADLFIFTA